MKVDKLGSPIYEQSIGTSENQFPRLPTFQSSESTPAIRRQPASSLEAKGGDWRESFISKTKQKESGGNYKARNPNSSATGAYQFLWGTWGNQIKAVTGVKSREEFDNSPAKQDQFMRHYVDTTVVPTVEKLQQFNYANLTPIQLAQLVHFRGVAGAESELKNKTLGQKHEGYNPSSASYLGYRDRKYAGGGGLSQYGGLASAAAPLVGSIFPSDSPGGAAASGALSGAAAGAALGPIGMGVGALIGGVTSFIGAKKANRQKREAAESTRLTTALSGGSYDEGVDSQYVSQRYAKGGEPNGEYEVEKGEVVQGQDVKLADGKQIASDLHSVGGNTHDEGGTLGQGGDRVFSDRLTIDPLTWRSIRGLGFKIHPSSTYASAVHSLGKQKGKLENDNGKMHKGTKKLMLPRIDQAIETLFQGQEMSKLPMFAYGGNLPKYAKGGLVRGGTQRVQDMQNQLIKAGYKIKADGAWGDETNTAWNDMQKTQRTRVSTAPASPRMASESTGVSAAPRARPQQGYYNLNEYLNADYAFPKLAPDIIGGGTPAATPVARQTPAVQRRTSPRRQTPSYSPAPTVVDLQQDPISLDWSASDRDTKWNTRREVSKAEGLFDRIDSITDRERSGFKTPELDALTNYRIDPFEGTTQRGRWTNRPITMPERGVASRMDIEEIPLTGNHPANPYTRTVGRSNWETPKISGATSNWETPVIKDEEPNWTGNHPLNPFTNGERRNAPTRRFGPQNRRPTGAFEKAYGGRLPKYAFGGKLPKYAYGTDKPGKDLKELTVRGKRNPFNDINPSPISTTPFNSLNALNRTPTINIPKTPEFANVTIPGLESRGRKFGRLANEALTNESLMAGLGNLGAYAANERNINNMQTTVNPAIVASPRRSYQSSLPGINSMIGTASRNAMRGIEGTSSQSVNANRQAIAANAIEAGNSAALQEASRKQAADSQYESAVTQVNAMNAQSRNQANAMSVQLRNNQQQMRIENRAGLLDAISEQRYADNKQNLDAFNNRMMSEAVSGGRGIFERNLSKYRALASTGDKYAKMYLKQMGY